LERQIGWIDERLHAAGGTLEDCRKEMNDVRRDLIYMNQRCIAYTNAYHEERKRNLQCSKLYQSLFHQYEEKQREISIMARDMLSLQRDFLDAQTTILAHDAAVREYERRLAEYGRVAVPRNEQDMEVVPEGIQAKLAQLEQENAELLNALANAANLVIAAQGVRDSNPTAHIESSDDDNAEVKEEVNAEEAGRQVYVDCREERTRNSRKRKL
jgi:hypothetical protein